MIMPAQLAPIVNVRGTTPTLRLTKTAREIEAAVNGHRFSFGRARVTMIYGSTTWPDHNNDRCCDVMTSSTRKVLPDGSTKALTIDEQKEVGDFIVDYLWRNAERIGLNWAIWWHNIYRYQNTDRGHGKAQYTGSSNPHVDHVHSEVAPGNYTPPDGPAPVVDGKIDGKKAFTMYATKPINGYAGPPAVGVVRHHRKKGFRLIGYIGHRDGRYLVTRWDTWYPLDSLSTTKPKG